MRAILRGGRRLLTSLGIGIEAGVWNADDARRTFGPDATPYEIRHRLRCAKCGARAARVEI